MYCFAVNIQVHWVKSNVVHIISKAIDKDAVQYGQDGLSDNIIIIIITNSIREDLLYYKCIRH